MSDDLQELEYETHRFVVESALVGHRIDKAIALLAPEFSRSRLQALLRQGHVLLNGDVCAHMSYKVVEGDAIEIRIPAPVSALPEPQNIPLDIVYQDSDLLVINKPAGLVVHPGAGNYDGTLVNALLYHCAGDLSGIGGVLRPGIVHRLDKETSGLMIVAKNDSAHQSLSHQLADRTLSRQYHALVFKVPVPPKGRVDLPIGRDPGNRQKMAVNRRAGRDAVTRYHVIEHFKDACALVACDLETGRTHQIRVHMNALKHPLIGDPLYGPQPNALQSTLKKAVYGDDALAACLGFKRQALHARALAFVHPGTRAEMRFESSPPDDMSNLLNILRK